jgi:hypothetical protein
LRALVTPFLTDPLRRAVVAGHLTADDEARERAAAKDANYAFAVAHNVKTAHEMLEDRMRLAGFGTAQKTTVVTPRVWAGLDRYWGPADVPAEVA